VLVSFAARASWGRCRFSSDRLLRSAHGAAVPRRWGRRSGARRARGTLSRVLQGGRRWRL